MSKRKELEKSHAAELSSYLRYKQRVFESTDISDTDSSVSEGEVKRKRTLNYFGGSGIKQWVPKSMFVANNLNVTKLFLKFRSRNVILAEEISSINSLRILSLSHIFTVDKFDSERCVSYYCSALKDSLHKYAYENTRMNKVSMEAIYYCKQLIDTIDENKDTDEIEFNPKNTIDIHVKEITLEFVSVAADNNTNSESTFIDKYILPFVRKVLLKKSNIIYSIIDAYDDKSEKKPDVTIGFKDRKRIVNAIYLKVKRPNITSKYQAENDYVKLLKQLKTSINFQVKLNIMSPGAFGVHCDGFGCSLIQMKIIEDGIYLATTLRKFTLPKDTSSLLDIPRAVECFEFMLDELQKLQLRYNNRVKKQAIDEQKYIKDSFVTKLY